MTDSPRPGEAPAEDQVFSPDSQQAPTEESTSPPERIEASAEDLCVSEADEALPPEGSAAPDAEEPPEESGTAPSEADGEEDEESPEPQGSGAEIAENLQNCPFCGEPIIHRGRYCYYCGADMTTEPPFPAPEPSGAQPLEEPEAPAGELWEEPEPSEEESEEERPRTRKEKWKRFLRIMGAILTTLGLLGLLAVALGLVYFQRQARELRASAGNSVTLTLPGARPVINYASPVDPEKLGREGQVLFVSDELLAVAEAGISYTDIERFFGEREISIVGYLEPADVYQLRLPEPRGLDELDRLARELEQEPEIDCAAVNLVWEPTLCAGPRDPWDGETDWEELRPGAPNWGLLAIRAVESWKRFQPGTVRVGVMDAAFDPGQQDLRYGRILKEGSEPAPVDPETRPRGHGGAVAAVIGAVHDNGVGISGAAKDCLIYARGCDGLCSQMDVLSCIAVLASEDVRVICFGLGYPEEITAALARGAAPVSSHYGASASRMAELGLGRMLDKGYDFLLVLPAGNGVNGESADAGLNSLLSQVSEERVRGRILVVGAAGLNEEGVYYPAPFSNSGERVDLLAPGVGVGSLSGDGELVLWDGSSMAAAYAAGICAQAWELNPGLSGGDLRDLLVRTADIPVPGSSVGMADMYAALEAAEQVAEEMPLRPAEEAALDAYAELLHKGVKLQGRKPGILLPARHYLLLDMNKDGVQELLLYALDENELSASFALYSYRNGELVQLGNAWETCRYAAWSNMNLTLQVCEGRFLYAEASRTSEGYGETGESFWLSYSKSFKFKCMKGYRGQEDGERLSLIEDSKITDQGIPIGSARDTLWGR